MSNVQTVKQRFEIIGNDTKLNRAIEKGLRVGPTDISVLITGESGVGKEAMPKIIHSESHRKHGKYIAVNCGAIPEGTIDSELFGHEKGAFTGATQTRLGYFEVADKGTIFLDEVGELPLPTQVRLLRVLDTGEYMKVGSSKVQKTDVRIIAATNVDMQQSIKKERLREDLYYRLSTVEIELPPLARAQRRHSPTVQKICRRLRPQVQHAYHQTRRQCHSAALEVPLAWKHPPASKHSRANIGARNRAQHNGPNPSELFAALPRKQPPGSHRVGQKRRKRFQL